MKTQALLLLAFSSTAILAADYYQPSCPGGNCPYPNQNQSYYQGQSQNYRQGYPQQQYNHSNAPQNSRYDQQTYDQNPQAGYSQQNYDQRYRQQSSYDGQNYGNQDSNYQRHDQNSYYQNSNQSPSYSKNTRMRDSEDINNQRTNYNDQRIEDRDRAYTRSDKRISDEEIAKQVHDAVSSSWLSSGYPDVTFDVNNGVINLRGFVKTDDEKIKLENSVRKIEGVTEINNEVRVAEPKTANNSLKRTYLATADSKTRKTETSYPQDSALSDSDRIINSKLRNKLSGWFTKGYETITFDTSNGVVTITGFVEKFDDIQKISNEAKNLEGVKTVHNKVSVKK